MRVLRWVLTALVVGGLFGFGSWLGSDDINRAGDAALVATVAYFVGRYGAEVHRLEHLRGRAGSRW